MHNCCHVLVIYSMCTVEPTRSGQSRPNSVRISEFHLVSHAKPVKRTKFLLSEIRTLVRHVYEYHASFYRLFLLFFIVQNIDTNTSINNICEYFVENHVRSGRCPDLRNPDLGGSTVYPNEINALIIIWL